MTSAPELSLAERLGYTANTRLVIISCDDLGSSHASNEGVCDALRHGVATCASLMVPAPWARDAAGWEKENRLRFSIGPLEDV